MTATPVIVQDGVVSTQTSAGNATHTLVPNDSVSTFRRMLDDIEHIPRELVAFFEARFGHHAL